MKKILCPILIILLFSIGCHNHDSEKHEHEAESLEAGAYTLYTDKTELFVEFKPIIVGQPRRFAAHITKLGHLFKPLTEGSVTVSLVKDGRVISNKVDSASSPGIFRPELVAKVAGTGFVLIFDIVAKEYRDKFTISNISVYTDEKTALSAQKEEPGGNDVIYLKEQAWKVEFANMPVKKQRFYEVIKTSGQITSAQGDEQIITAQSGGIVKFGNNKIVAGTEVSSGDILFTISGKGLAGDNIDASFKEAKANFEKSQVDYERAKELVKDKIISEKDFQEIRLRFENAQTVYNTYEQNYSKEGLQIKSPASGFIKNILIRDGQFVEQGQVLASVSQNKRLVLKADVSQKDFSKLAGVSSANFKTPTGKLYNTDSLNGKLLSYGKSSENTFFTPVYFEIDNKGNLISGSFVEIYLRVNSSEQALVVPVSSLIEEQGVFYVYVQTSGESFEKREVALGTGDGMQVQLLSGVKEGERVVTKGAYQIKLSTMSGTLPGHGHEH